MYETIKNSTVTVTTTLENSTTTDNRVGVPYATIEKQANQINIVQGKLLEQLIKAISLSGEGVVQVHDELLITVPNKAIEDGTLDKQLRDFVQYVHVCE